MNKFGSPPIVFLDDEKRKEWEALDPAVREASYKMLHK